MKLSKIIKFIRESMALSQEDFAAKIGVERLAISRWENEQVTPNKLAQTRLFEVAKASGVNVYDFMIKDLPKHKIDGSKIVLYHGSKTGIAGDIRPLSRDRCDFGQGFYLGTQVQQPLTLICTNPQAVLYVVELDLKGLKVVEIPTDIDWAMLVAYCRGRLDKVKGSRLYEKYSKMLEGCDVAVGSIANDRMFYVLDRFFDGTITDKGLVESLSALQLGVQYVALTDKACKQIKVIYSEQLPELARLCLDDISEQNRQYGIETANEICKTYRREGKFFDEILKEANNA